MTALHPNNNTQHLQRMPHSLMIVVLQLLPILPKIGPFQPKYGCTLRTLPPIQCRLPPHAMNHHPPSPLSLEEIGRNACALCSNVLQNYGRTTLVAPHPLSLLPLSPLRSLESSKRMSLVLSHIAHTVGDKKTPCST